MNPRPQTLHEKLYVCSRSFGFKRSAAGRHAAGTPICWVSPVVSQPHIRPADGNYLAGLATPIIGNRLRSSPGFKRRGRNVRRSRLTCFQWIYELTGARHALAHFVIRVETRSAPSAEAAKVTWYGDTRMLSVYLSCLSVACNNDAFALWFGFVWFDLVSGLCRLAVFGVAAWRGC